MTRSPSRTSLVPMRTVEEDPASRTALPSGRIGRYALPSEVLKIRHGPDAKNEPIDHVFGIGMGGCNVTESCCEIVGAFVAVGDEGSTSEWHDDASTETQTRQEKRTIMAD